MARQRLGVQAPIIERLLNVQRREMHGDTPTIVGIVGGMGGDIVDADSLPDLTADQETDAGRIAPGSEKFLGLTRFDNLLDSPGLVDLPEIGVDLANLGMGSQVE